MPASVVDSSKKRKPPKEDVIFYEENGYGWDFVMVFQVFDELQEITAYQKKHSMKNVLHKLSKGGLQTKMFYSVQRDEVYCKIRASLPRLLQQADIIDLQLKLDPHNLRELAHAGVTDSQGESIVKPIVISKHIQIGDPPQTFTPSQRDPYTDIYGKYDDASRLQRVYAKYGPEHKKCCLRSVDRLKLIVSIVTTKGQGGCGVDIAKHIEQRAVLAFYPLHEEKLLNELRRTWLVPFAMPNDQPFDLIKDYFGEKVALYFVWLAQYTTWLVGPAIVGFAAALNTFIVGDADAAMVPAFGIFMCFWSTFFMEYWKRRNAILRLEWGMTDFEQTESVRPQYKGEVAPSPITGEDEIVGDWGQRRRALMHSVAVLLGMVLLVLSMMVAIYSFHYWTVNSGGADAMTSNEGVSMGPWVAYVLNALQIQAMSAVFGGIAIGLNDMENHRTDTEYEDYLIGKVFAFQFINSFGSLFYIAFAKEAIGDSCFKDKCMNELRNALATIIIVRLVIGNVQEVAIPYCMRLKRERSEKARGDVSDRQASEAEEQFYKQEYDIRGTFDDFAEMIIQFGYASLFVAAFPLAPLLAFLNNYVEIRVDAFKLLAQTRRPEPRGAEDIGTWQSILELMGTVSVITNSLIVCFTADKWTGGMTYGARMALFVLMEHSILSIKYCFGMLVPDTPEEVEIQLQRQDFLTRKLILLEPDDDDDEMETTKMRVNLEIADSTAAGHV